MFWDVRRVAIVCLLVWVGMQLLVPFSAVLANPMDYELHPDIKNWEVHPDIENWRSPDYEVPDFKHGTPNNPEGSNPPSQDGSNSQDPGSNNPGNPGGSSGNGEDGSGEGNWLAPILKAKAGIIGKIGFFYYGAYKQGMRLLPVIEKNKITGYLLTGKPKNWVEKITKGKYYFEGQKLGLKNNFTTFGKGFLREIKALGNWGIGAALAAWSAYEDYKLEGFTTNVVAEFINETLWNVGTAAGGMAVGSAIAGWFAGAAAGTAAGATIGSAVPVIGTVAGAVIGGVASVIINNTSIGQKAKSATKSFFKWCADGVKSLFS